MSTFGAAEYGNITPHKAIDYWASKKPVIKSEWATLSERERDRAFTAANIMEANKLQQVYDIIGDAVKNGDPVNIAKDKILAVADITTTQAETIVRTNIASAYSAGRFQEMSAVSKYRPYWKYLSIDDDSTRASHLVLNGVVYPANDPFWTVNFPPNGYRCRCDTASLSERQVRAHGIEVVTTKDKPFVVNKAFARNPLDLYAPVLDKYSPQVRQKFIENAVNYANGDMVRLKKLLTQGDLVLAESIMATNGYQTKEDVIKWIENVYNEKRPKGELAPMGNLPPKVLRFLKKKNKEPKLALVTLSDSEIAHMARDTKQQRGAALTVEEAKAIPTKFRAKSTKWYYDGDNDSVLMAFIRDDDDWLKVAIKTDRKVGNGIANEIITTGRVDEFNLNKYTELFDKI